jgi:hypothetical protein
MEVAARPISPIGFSADTENNYVLSCGIPGLQGKTLPKRNGTSSSTGSSCSGILGPVHTAHSLVTPCHCVQHMLQRGEELPVWALTSVTQSAREEASRLQAESQLRGKG